MFLTERAMANRGAHPDDATVAASSVLCGDTTTKEFKESFLWLTVAIRIDSRKVS